jgi:FG-GAP-like repeat
MKARSYNGQSAAAVESLEGRSLMSAVVVATDDLNNDSLPDRVEVTNPTTITVSLQQADGTFKVSAVLTTPKNRPVGGLVNVVDIDHDGDLDINTAGNINSSSYYVHRWLNNGDGTFGAISSQVYRFKPHGFLGF